MTRRIRATFLRSLFVALPAACLLASSPLRAETPIQFHGFITAAFSQSDSPAYRNNQNNTSNFLEDGVAGLNISAQLADSWSAILQMRARSRALAYTQEIDWAILSWQPTSSLSIRAGKQKVATWLISDHLDVGILYPWVRPPGEVYELNPVSTFSGISADYSLSLGSEWSLLGHLYFGDADLTAYSSPEQETVGSVRHVTGGALTLSDSEVSLRASYTQGIGFGTLHRTIQYPFLGFLTRFVIDVPFSFDHFRLTTLGAKADWNDLLVMTEFANFNTQDPGLKSANAWYGTLGYYLPGRRWLPYLTYSTLFNVDSYVIGGVQKTWLAGLNYQINPSIVLKSSYEVIGIDGAAIIYTRGTTSPIHGFSLALSAVF